MAQSVLHRADTRGDANHGWLHSRHTFSFADYYDPERVHFGVLRVLNDDIVEGGMGFGPHPHDNMEIVSLPLEGDLEHKDSMGNVAVIRNGDVQVMSAGTGIVHSEFNKNPGKRVKFLQIWVLPDKSAVEPRYGQITLNKSDRHNTFQQIVSPFPGETGLWIHQKSWFHLGDLDKGVSLGYTLKAKGNGLYVFVLDGEVTIDKQQLHPRDGLGIWDTDAVSFTAGSNVELLLMEVPMAV